MRLPTLGDDSKVDLERFQEMVERCPRDRFTSTTKLLIFMVKEQADVRRFFQEQPNLSTASWAVRFAASLENVLVVLSGMSNMEQVEDNTSCMKDFQPLSDVEQDAVKQVVAAIRSKITVDCTACDGCGKCETVCPQKLPIRELLKEVKGAFEL